MSEPQYQLGVGKQTRISPQDGAFGAIIRCTFSTSGLSTSFSYSVRGALHQRPLVEPSTQFQ